MDKITRYGFPLIAGFLVFLAGYFYGIDRSKGESTSDNQVRNIQKTAGHELIRPKQGFSHPVIIYSEDFLTGGGITSSAGLKLLKRRGVDTVISLSPSPDIKKESDEYGIDYIEKRSGEALKEEVVKEILSIVKTNKVYIEDKEGVKNGRLLGLAYRLYINKWKKEKGLREFYSLCAELEYVPEDIERIAEMKNGG